MDPVVRLAESADAEDLARLESLARASLTDVRGGQLRLQECSEIGDWTMELQRAGIHVFVGTLDAAVVGYMVLTLDVLHDRGLITHAFVEPDARELGLGDGMVEQAIDVVRAAGLRGIESVALPGDRETKNLFERAGLTARKIIVYKSLVGPDAPRQ